MIYHNFDAVVMQKYFTGKIGILLNKIISGFVVLFICSIQFEKLDSDLKNYKSNSIKESIR